MNRITKVVGTLSVALAVCVSLWSFGFRIGVFSIPAPSKMFRVSTGQALDMESGQVKRVDITGIIPYLRDAGWSTADGFWKLPIKIRLDDGEELTIDRVQNHYRLSGIKGSFFVVDREAFEAKVSEMMSKP